VCWQNTCATPRATPLRATIHATSSVISEVPCPQARTVKESRKTVMEKKRRPVPSPPISSQNRNRPQPNGRTAKEFVT